MLRALVERAEPAPVSETKRAWTPERQRHLDDLAARARRAAAAFYQFSQEQVDRCVRAMVLDRKSVV